MEQLFILTDYRGQFYSSTRYRGASVDLDKLKSYFTNLGYELVIMPFSKVNFRTQNYRGKWVLYQSSEDPGLFYRNYIEDIIMGLYLQGAKIIPSISQFRAHHNKHFMEIVRDLHSLSSIKNIEASRYGTYEDYEKDIEKFQDKQYVLKSSHTSKSKGVFLLSNNKQRYKLPKAISRSPSLQNLRYVFERIKTGKKPLHISNHRNKFTLQQYISDLKGDYRVVIYGDKFYVLYRSNRRNDFRASGSMIFNYDISLPNGLLDYAKQIFDSFDTPFIALDIGFKNNEFFLFEFQFISFGQYTLEKSKFYYSLKDNTWQKELEKPDLEREIASSVSLFIDKHKTKPCVA